MTSKKTPPPRPGAEVLSALSSLRTATEHAAVLFFDNKVYAARSQAGSLGSAVFRLVLGLHETDPQRAHLLLRQRIWTTSPPAALDRAVVQIGASKLSSAVEVEPQAHVSGVTMLNEAAAAAASRASEYGFEQMNSEALAPADLMARVVDASTSDVQVGALHARNRAIAAGLVQGGRLLAMSRSLGGANRLLHAEICLMLGWAACGKPWPPGAEVYTSLSPCRMCAVALAAMSAGKIVVRYAARDDGRLATHTVLDESGGACLQHPAL